jgi:hypothetical protein
MAKALPLFEPMVATSTDANRSVLFPLCGWTFWLGDSGASGVVLLLGGVVLEDCARSVY